MLFLAAACAGDEGGRPAGDTARVAPDAARLGFRLPAFAEAGGTHSHYRSADGRYAESFAEWRLSDGTTAGLALSTARGAAPITDPTLPAEILAIWPRFSGKRPALGKAAAMHNELGPVFYQRAAVGTQACVLFVQRWPEPDPRIAPAARATLSGYYCNPPGVLLTPDAALIVLRAVALRPPRGQS